MVYFPENVFLCAFISAVFFVEIAKIARSDELFIVRQMLYNNIKNIALHA